MGDAERRAEIARLNDHLRLTGQGGQVFITQGIATLSPSQQFAILAAVRRFDAITYPCRKYGLVWDTPANIGALAEDFHA